MPPLSLAPTGASATGDLETPKSANSPSQDAFLAVIQRHSALILGVCRRMLGEADAEDAAQAVFVLYWQKALQIQDESRVVGWLHRTAQHVCRNARRSGASRIKHEQQAAVESQAMSRESVDTAQWNEIKEILDEEIDRLPEKLRIAFVLFHCEQHSLAEVAELVGSTVSTVGTWLQRSREKLAGSLRKRGVVIGAATLATILSQHVAAEAVPVTFVAATSQTISGVSATGLAGCSPAVAALVKAGTVGGLSKSFWIAWSFIVAAVGFPLIVMWLLPVLQTRQSPDFPLLQGEWREVTQEQSGGPMNVTSPIAYVSTLRISGRNFRRLQTLADGRVLPGGNGTFVIDSSQHPAVIDFNQWQGTAYGIYELAGDTLTVCVTRNGGPRPDGLSTTKNDGRILSRYKRVQKLP